MSDLRTGTFLDGTARFFALYREGDLYMETFEIRTCGTQGRSISSTRTGVTWPATSKGWKHACDENARKNLAARRWER